MQKIRYGLIALFMLICTVPSADAQVSIGIGLPNLSIGINLPLFPELLPVPGYPVYYAPRIDANYFFYDGMYWVYQDDNWYASSWYNGPWGIVDPEIVPLFILRIPVRYYRRPPVYFRGWRQNAPPRWGEHWGHNWEQHRRGWDRWNRGSGPSRAPLPTYQRRYTGDRYPRTEQQQMLRSRHYRYQPRERIDRDHFRQGVERKAPAPSRRGRDEGTPVRGPRQQGLRPQTPPHQGAPVDTRSQPRLRGDGNFQRPVPLNPTPQQRRPEIRQQRELPGTTQHMRQAPGPQGREQRSPQSNRGQGQGQMQDEGRGRERNK
jgi:hypothetical protein